MKCIGVLFYSTSFPLKDLATGHNIAANSDTISPIKKVRQHHIRPLYISDKKMQIHWSDPAV